MGSVVTSVADCNRWNYKSNRIFQLMAILLIDIEIDDDYEEYILLDNYFSTMIEQLPATPHYRVFKCQGLNVPKDNTEINPTFFELSTGRIAIGHING